MPWQPYTFPGLNGQPRMTLGDAGRGFKMWNDVRTRTKDVGRGRRGWCVFLAAGVATQVSAQQPPDPPAQELVRQQERERVLRGQQESRPDVRLERTAEGGIERLPVAEDPCFRIDRIVLEGNQAEHFAWALRAADPKADPATGRCLGTEGINLVMKHVQNAIIARGYCGSWSARKADSGFWRWTRSWKLPGRRRTIADAERTGDQQHGNLRGKAPVAYGHILAWNLNRQAQGVGGHYLRSPNVNVTRIAADAGRNGIAKGKVEVRDPVTGKWVAKKAETSFFPKDWSRRQMEMEIENAFANSTMKEVYGKAC